MNRYHALNSESVTDYNYSLTASILITIDYVHWKHIMVIIYPIAEDCFAYTVY